jgi:DNA-binding NarL/FixJ family response regulator
MAGMSTPVPEDQPESDAGVATRVVVIDDHALFREGVVSAIGDQVDVVGQADDIHTGIAVVREMVPDVVLLDVHLASGSGQAIIEVLRAELPEVAYLALSVSDAAEDVLGLVRAGARGYVTKRIDGGELVAAIEQVATGNAVFSPRLAGFVLDAFTDAFGGTSPARPAVAPPASTQPAEPPAPSDPALDCLTAREREVMQHLARGYAYKEIAEALVISVRTVESHARAVLRKLQLSSRNELAHWANRNRLL